jgi:hypothetical protein
MSWKEKRSTGRDIFAVNVQNAIGAILSCMSTIVLHTIPAIQIGSEPSIIIRMESKKGKISPVLCAPIFMK